MKIKVRLNARSFDEAIRQVNKYRDSLEAKNEEFVKRLSELGIKVAKSIISSVPSEDRGDVDYPLPIIKSDGTVAGAVFKIVGDQVMFLEFSAGIKYGTQDYPLPSGAPYGAGTYPAEPDANGRYNWSKPGGWWYPDETSPTGYRHTYGVRAYMPMYHATEAIALRIREIASQCFK